MNTFMYTPWSSMHSQATKAGIVMGELFRLNTNCDNHGDFLKCVEFLRSKLIARGYPAQFLDDCEAKFRMKQQQKTSSSLGACPSAKVVDSRQMILFKIPFGPVGRRMQFMKLVRQHFHLLNSNGIAVLNTSDRDGTNDDDDDADVLKHSKWRFINCYTCSLNLFRRRYSRFLGSTG